MSRRKHSARVILAMTLKLLTTKSEVKDIYAYFGVTHTYFIDHVELGMSTVTHSLFSHKLSRVKWVRSEEGMRIASKLTNEFVGLGGHAIGKIEGLKLESQEPSDSLEQNGDHNGSDSTANRIFLLAWDPHGKIVDAGANLL